MATILKFLFWPVNLLFGYIIYFLSIRPLSPSSEQLIENYSHKAYIQFIAEWFSEQGFLALLFSAIVFLLFKNILKGVFKKYPFFYLFLIYLIFSLFCGLEFLFYINKIVY
ncbi:hypothetical protein AHMF7605_12290 [Adhaeribacter arboris]|uniref:Uncharacterized protein n=1 Tax=Adhaeribacter arboris TaxID=2072846 RepID=A0A2T2YFG2_9BACT|nr:hypothetical protein AHMF7605_12290 [Adhaeribacter arboris]